VNIVAALPRIAPLLARHALGYAGLANDCGDLAGEVARPGFAGRSHVRPPSSTCSGSSASDYA